MRREYGRGMNLRAHLTYANVTATLALFVALGGSSYAALRITGRDVKDNSLTGRDVRALTSRDIRDDSLLREDFRSDGLPAHQIQVRFGPTGIGDCFTGCAGVAETSSTARCEPGERATGGGVAAPSNFEDSVVTASYPQPSELGSTPTGWYGTARFTVTTDSAAIPSPQVWVVCASP
jgi:hypothetical protein